MKHSIVTPVECENCHRLTLTYNVDVTGRKLCPVCITELSQQARCRPGPTEVKQNANTT